MQTYGQAFQARCYELAQTVNLDAISVDDDRQFFYDMFTRYLGMIEEYYAIKMHAEQAAQREKLSLVHCSGVKSGALISEGDTA